MELRNVVSAIINGELDDDLNDIVSAINARRQAQAQSTKAMLRVGDRVRFTSQARKFAGQEGTIKAKLQKNVEVKLDDDYTVVRAHPSLVEVIG